MFVHTKKVQHLSLLIHLIGFNSEREGKKKSIVDNLILYLCVSHDRKFQKDAYLPLYLYIPKNIYIVELLMKVNN